MCACVCVAVRHVPTVLAATGLELTVKGWSKLLGSRSPTRSSSDTGTCSPPQSDGGQRQADDHMGYDKWRL